MTKFKFIDEDGDQISFDTPVEGSILFTSRSAGIQSIQVNTPKKEAIELARALLKHFGAGLEDSKPEPAAGQVWRSIPEGGQLIITEVSGNGVWFLEKGANSVDSYDYEYFVNAYDFVSQSWTALSETEEE